MSEVAVSRKPLPVSSKSHHPSGWWGMLALVATESALFAYLLFCYFYLAAHAIDPWPPHGLPKLDFAVPSTIIMIAGSLIMWWGERGIRRGNNRQLRISLGATSLLGLGFLALQFIEWSNKPFQLTSSAYSSSYFIITGFDMAHVAVGVIMMLVLLIWSCLHYFDENRHSAVPIGVIYWHFVTIVWLAVFFTFYIAPRLGAIP